MMQFPVIMSSVALVLSLLSLSLLILLRLVWSPSDRPSEQQKGMVDVWTPMFKVVLASVAVSALLWLLAAHLSAHRLGLVCLTVFLAVPAFAKLLRRTIVTKRVSKEQ